MLTRRSFLEAVGAATLVSNRPSLAAASAPKRIAIITTIWKYLFGNLVTKDLDTFL